MSTLALLFIFLVVLPCLVYYWKMRRFYYASREMNGPIALPFVGNFLYFIGSAEDVMQKVLKLYLLYGNPMRVWIGTRFMVGTTDPEDLEVLFNHPNTLGKNDFYRFFGAFLGDGLVTNSNVSTWRFHRKLIAPTFNMKILNGFIPVFEEQSRVLCKDLASMVGAGSFDVFPWIGRCTLDSICGEFAETAMGAKVNAQANNCEFVHWIDRMSNITYERVLNVFHHNDFIFGLTKEKRELDELVRKSRNFTDKVIQAKRDELHQKSAHCHYEEPQGVRKTFLDYLLEISEETGHFTNEELRDEVQTFIVAGSDTSAGTESFVLMMLGMHPEIQEKVIEEQREIFVDNDRAITSEDLAHMKYLERAIKETLRLFPVGPILSRVAAEDVKLRTYTVPKGASCALGVFYTHRDPKIWRDPLKFDPDRFLPEEIAKRHPYSWIPFSAGPRNCMGIKYAMMSMKATLSLILRRYKVSCPYKNVEDIRLKIGIVLKAVEGFNIALELRK